MTKLDEMSQLGKGVDTMTIEEIGESLSDISKKVQALSMQTILDQYNNQPLGNLIISFTNTINDQVIGFMKRSFESAQRVCDGDEDEIRDYMIDNAETALITLNSTDITLELIVSSGLPSEEVVKLRTMFDDASTYITQFTK